MIWVRRKTRSLQSQALNEAGGVACHVHTWWDESFFERVEGETYVSVSVDELHWTMHLRKSRVGVWEIDGRTTSRALHTHWLRRVWEDKLAISWTQMTEKEKVIQ